MTVVAPGGGRTSTRVPANVPVAQLAPALGAAVNVANVSDLDDDRGTRIPGTSTLAESGMTDGSTVHVVVPGFGRPAARQAAPAATGAADAPSTSPSPVGAFRAAAVPLPMALVGALVAAVFFLLGGVILGGLFGDGVLGSGPTAPGPGPIGRQAAAAWLDARPFSGPLAPGVPAGFGRSGAIAATLQAAGGWHHGSDAGQLFVVVPATPAAATPAAATPAAATPAAGVTAPRTPFTLTVVTRDGKVAFPPTVSLIPMVGGRLPPSPGRSKVTGGGPLPAPVAAWVQDRYGAKGASVPVLQLGLAGDPKVLAGWRPGAGGTVYRIGAPLDSFAPGTAGAQLMASSRALAAKVSADGAVVTADQAALALAQAQARTAEQVAAAANPPNPPPLAAAVAAANAAAITDGQRLSADTATLTADQDAATKAAAAARGLTRTATVATYDVWVRDQAVIGWAPAGYGLAG
jgi:hypothetical protein